MSITGENTFISATTGFSVLFHPLSLSVCHCDLQHCTCSPEVRRPRPLQFLPPKKDFIQAKYDFIDEMLKFGHIDMSKAVDGQQIKILDVGCGIGGTSRFVIHLLILICFHHFAQNLLFLTSRQIPCEEVWQWRLR